MKQQIRDLINQTIQQLGLPAVDFSIETPAIESHGDLAANVAMVLFPKVKAEGTYKSPRDLAKKMVDVLRSHDLTISRINDISVAGPGFINFRLNNDMYLDGLKTILEQKENYGKTDKLKGKKVSVEYTDPNPFKELHIGHLYSNIVGETISRLLETNGATVWRADYFGDVGMHVAKSIWGLLKKFSLDKTSLESLTSLPLNDRVKYLGQAYALGASAYEESDSDKEEMKDLNYIIYVVAQRFLKESRGWEPQVNYQQFISANKYVPDEIFTIYKTCRTWSLEYFETIYKRLGTKFDGYYPESIMGEYGYKTVQQHLQDVFETGDKGAVIFPGKKYGLHDRVFINSLGLPTYECKELGLAPAKYEDFAYEQSIIVTGNEINDYFNVLIKAMTLVNPALGNVTTHIGHGMVRLPEGKMSSRTGKVVTGEWLLNEAKNSATQIIEKLNPTLEDKENVSEKVGLAAIRYALLKASIGSDVIFNFAESVSFNGNSGPYLQYTVARANSVIAKAASVIPTNASEPINEEELSLLRALTKFPEVVKKASDELSPHMVCEYCYDTASRFNTFYNKHQIAGSKFRLELTEATAHVLKNALKILGIECPEKM